MVCAQQTSGVLGVQKNIVRTTIQPNNHKNHDDDNDADDDDDNNNNNSNNSRAVQPAARLN